MAQGIRSASAAWTAAGIVIVISVISTFTLHTPVDTTSPDVATAVGSGAGNDGAGPASDGVADADVPDTGETFASTDTGGTDTQAGAANTNETSASMPRTDGARPAQDDGEAQQPQDDGDAQQPQDDGGDTGPLECAPGRNGGATDTGVTDREIRLATTVVKSGVGRSFLGEVDVAMDAVIARVNQSGGICGRQLSLKKVDDGWKASEGQQQIKRFIQEGFFAMPVVPSSEGLRLAANSGDIDRAGIPVVGTDGMLIHQYTDDWIWSVATSTSSQMHIMAKNAYDRGARTFGIVWEQNYRFGVEGEAAFKGALSRLDGAELVANQPIQGGQGSYSNEVSSFNDTCIPDGRDAESSCDFVALLLEPQTAGAWVRDGGYLGDGTGAIGAGGAQPLFGRDFAEDFAARCPSPCTTDFWVWTSFKPPLSPFDSEPAVSQYANTMSSYNASADRDNQFVQGGYDGMLLLVEALQRVGPNLTRDRLRATLDSMCFDSGLAAERCYRPDDHFANTAALAYELVVSQGSFSGFRYTRSGFVEDPWVGQDIPQG